MSWFDRMPHRRHGPARISLVRMSRSTSLVLAAALSALASCNTTSRDPAYVATGRGLVPARPSLAVDRLRAAAADRTTIVGQRAASGTPAVTYLAKDGSGFVWKDDAIVRIRWTVEDSASGNGVPNICYDSPLVPPNYLELRRGERINCLSGLFLSATDTVTGDPMRLSIRGAPPFRLQRGNYSLAELVAKVRQSVR